MDHFTGFRAGKTGWNRGLESQLETRIPGVPTPRKHPYALFGKAPDAYAKTASTQHVNPRTPKRYTQFLKP